MIKGSLGDPDEFNPREERLYEGNQGLRKLNHDIVTENNRLKFRLGNYEKAQAGYTVVYITEEPNALAYYIEAATSIEDAKQVACGRFQGQALSVFVFKGKSLPL